MLKQLLKKTYTAIPYKRQLFSFVKKIGCPPKSVYKHLHFKGDFSVELGRNRKFKLRHFGYIIENEVFWEGIYASWEKESMKLWIKLCEEADTILDIGANTGLYALVAKACNPSSMVVAFEPHPEFFDMMRQNIQLNEFDITAEQKAATDRNGRIELEDYSGKSAKMIFEGVALATYFEANQLPPVKLIKIDVESHEPEVLAGMGAYLEKYKPTLLIEVLSEEIAQRIVPYIDKCGYLYFNIDERNGIRRTDILGKSDYYNYLLCLPEVATRMGLMAVN